MGIDINSFINGVQEADEALVIVKDAAQEFSDPTDEHKAAFVSAAANGLAVFGLTVDKAASSAKFLGDVIDALAGGEHSAESLLADLDSACASRNYRMN